MFPHRDAHTALRNAQVTRADAQARAEVASFDATPTDQLVSSDRLACALRAGDAYCWDPTYKNSGFDLRARGPFDRLAIFGSVGICGTNPEGRVFCDEREVALRDPRRNLTASTSTVCAADGRLVTCLVYPGRFHERETRRLEFELAPEAGEVAALDLYDHSQRTSVVVVDTDGGVWSWADIRADTPSEPRRWEVEPMRSMRVNHHGWAGVTTTGEVLYTAELTGLSPGRRKLCGVDDAIEVDVGRFILCARTPSRLVCASHKQLDDTDWRRGPLHQDCSTTGGPMVRSDIGHFSMSDVGPTCATTGNNVRCVARREGKPFRAKHPLVLQSVEEIASTDHFVCGRTDDGTVRCAGPSFGDLGGSEEVKELRGVSRIYSGNHVVCGHRDQKLHCYFRGTGRDDPNQSTWVRIRPLDMPEAPDVLRLTDHDIAWAADTRSYRYDLRLPDRDEAAPWRLERASSRKQPRFQNRRVREIAKGPELRDAAGKYYLLADGSLVRRARKQIGLPALIFGLATGGVLIPVMEMRQPMERDVIAKLRKAVELSAGAKFGCYRSDVGEVYCFGFDDDGEVSGRPGGSHISPKRAHRVPLPVAAQQIESGAFHTCALLDSGDVHCWGRWGFRLIREDDDHPEWPIIRTRPYLAAPGP